jgi:chloramphenicol 3-O-phosphotransferase
LDVIEAREKLRNDRQPGTARAQYEQISLYKYDILIDTSKCTADEAASNIILNLKPGHHFIDLHYRHYFSSQFCV